MDITILFAAQEAFHGAAAAMGTTRRDVRRRTLPPKAERRHFAEVGVTALLWQPEIAISEVATGHFITSHWQMHVPLVLLRAPCSDAWLSNTGFERASRSKLLPHDSPSDME